MFRADPPISPSHSPAWIVGVLLLALLVRLAFVLALPIDEELMFRSLPDQREYVESARSVLAGEGLRFIDLRFGSEVRAFRMPGYPLLVAGCGASVRVVRVVQAVIDTSTVLAVFLMARRWLEFGPSVLAAAATAVNPFLIFFCSLILTETLFTSMLAWSVALLAMSSDPRRRKGRGLFWTGAAVTVISIYVRPSALALPLVLGIAATLAGAVPRRSGRFSLPVGAGLLILTLLMLLPWAMRNRMILGQWVWTTTNGGFTLYDGLNPDADGSSDQSFVRRLPQLQTMGETARSQYLADEARAWATRNPLRVLELAGIKLGRMWSPIPLSTEYGGRRAYVWASAAYAGSLFILCLVGLRRRVLPTSTKALLLIPAIYFSVSHAVTVGSLRYRVPVEPMLMVIAASAVVARPRAGQNA